MAVAFLCDRCGGRMMGRPAHVFVEMSSGSTKKQEKHLCDNCQKLLVEFWESGGKEETAWTTG